MNYSYRKLIVLLLVFNQPINAQIIAPYLENINYNTNIDYPAAGGTNVFHNQLILDAFGTIDNSITPAVIASIRGARVDGYHQDPQGRQYFSFDADTRINGIPVLRSDIIRCDDSNCSTFSFFMDSVAESLQMVNINAFTLDPSNGQLVFSIESSSRLSTGQIYFSGDLIRFDGAAFSLFYNSLSDDLTRNGANIDALVWLPNDLLLASFANEGAFNEVHEYNLATQTWSIAYTPLNLGNRFGSINFNSLMASENDTIFRDSFELMDLP